MLRAKSIASPLAPVAEGDHIVEEGGEEEEEEEVGTASPASLAMSGTSTPTKATPRN